MDDLEYRFLIRFGTGTVMFRRDFDILPTSEKTVAYQLERKGLLTFQKIKDLDGNTVDGIILEPSGRVALAKAALDRQKKHDEDARAEKQREEDKKQADIDRKKQLRHDWGIALFSSFTGLIGGAILDHFTDIVELCVRLWGLVFPH